LSNDWQKKKKKKIAVACILGYLWEEIVGRQFDATAHAWEVASLRLQRLPRHKGVGKKVASFANVATAYRGV
jgi:hypothetical protein